MVAADTTVEALHQHTDLGQTHLVVLPPMFLVEQR